MQKKQTLKRALSAALSLSLLFPLQTAFADSGKTYLEPLGSQSGIAGNGSRYYLDYQSLAEEQEAAEELAILIASEGDVLLKNDNVLPFGKNIKRISLFGVGSYNLVHSGGGSGAGKTGENGIPFKNLETSLEAAGLKINPTLMTMYSDNAADSELPVTVYNNTVTSTYKSYNDAAIITISRVGSEDADLSSHDVAGHSNPNDHALMLSDNEKDLIKHAKSYFGKVIVLLNSSNVMQIPELAEEKTEDNLGVDAILWIGGVGNSGAMAVGKILTGEVNPSGKTVDTWEKDFSQGPTWTNFGTQSQNLDSNGARMDAAIYDTDGADSGFRTVEYREGIYMGYRYYETVYADAAEPEKDAAYSNVLYPFGYGLSYTTFDWKISEETPEYDVIDAPNQVLTFNIDVTNTGDTAGKDVVELYAMTPYTPGGIEKAAKVLVGFAKTDLLQPGETQSVEISLAAQDVASFDFDDRNNNGFIGYELETGDYTFVVGRDSHTDVLSVVRVVNEDIYCETDLVTGEEIKPVFTEKYTTVTDGYKAAVLSRESGMKQPEVNSVEERTWSKVDIEWLLSQENYQAYEDQVDDPWYVDEVPANWTQAVSHAEDFSDITIALGDMADVYFAEPILEDGEVTVASDEGTEKWTAFMNQLTWDELCDLVSKGGGTKEIQSLGLEASSYVDGPVQMGSGTLWPSAPVVAATYNTDLASEQGRLIGNEVILKGNYGGWAGPATNLHRNPLAGRAFEYYSEDPKVSAEMTASVVSAATEKGTITYVKHMMLNEQEQYRNTKGGVLTFADEQTIRELYAKPFEAAAKSGHTVAYMSSFNRIGYWNASVNYAMHKQLVRGEWQFKGRSITDAWVKGYDPINLLVRAGDEQPLGDGSAYPLYDITRGVWSAEENNVLIPASADEVTAGVGSVASSTHYYAVRMAAQHILFSTVNSITAKNCLKITKGEVSFGQYIPSSLSLLMEGMDDVTNLSVVSGELPEGISIEDSLITGTASVIGDYDVVISGVTNNWVTFEAPITIHVVPNLEVAYNGTELLNADGDTIHLKAGENADIKFYSEFFAYGGRYAMGGGLGGIEVETTGFGSDKPAQNVQVLNLYQQFENWEECSDTEAHPLYRGRIGAIPRAEDSTAGDMPVADVVGGNYAKAYEYAFTLTGAIPQGMQEARDYQMVYGLSYGSYDVEKDLTISGIPTVPGTYVVEVTLQIPAGGITAGWVGKLWFSGVYLGAVTRTITIVVE